MESPQKGEQDVEENIISAASVEQLEKHGAINQSFPEFKHLYDDLNFPRLVWTVENLLDKPNKQLKGWKRHLLDEGGFSVIRVKDRFLKEEVAIPCVLLPRAAVGSSHSLAKTIDLLLEQLREKYPPERMQKYYDDPREMKRLFYYKTRWGLSTGWKVFGEKFLNVPLWQMEIMLKKWQTDGALIKWAREFKDP